MVKVSHVEIRLILIIITFYPILCFGIYQFRNIFVKQYDAAYPRLLNIYLLHS